MPDKDADLGLLAAVTPHEWGPDQRASLDRWIQGHLIRASDLSWQAPAAGTDPVTGIDPVAIPDHDGAGVAVWASRAAFFIITSQTCDIAATGPGARHPFVQVSPVLRVDSCPEHRWAELTRFTLVDRVGLTGTTLGGRYVADLRINIPLSKALLLDIDPIAAFENEVDELRFANHLAAKVARPALHDFLSGTMVSEINRAIETSGADDSSWWSQVVEVRILVTGTRLAPRSVTLLVLSKGALPPASVDRWTTLSKTFEKRAREAGFTVSTPWCDRLDDTKASLYRDSVGLAVKLRQPEMRVPL